MAEVHPITGMPLEDGHGCLPPDMQARNVHVPYIRATQGDAAADAMLAKLAKLDHAENGLTVVEPKAAAEPEPKEPDPT